MEAVVIATAAVERRQRENMEMYIAHPELDEMPFLAALEARLNALL